MKAPNFVNSALLAVALTAPTFAEDVKDTKATTQTGVATALATKDDTSNKGKIKQVSFQEMSPEEQKKLVEEAGLKTIDFLKKNAPEYAGDKKVLVATTAGLMECMNNGKDEGFFFRQLTKIINNKFTRFTLENFEEYTPNFMNSVGEDGLIIYKPFSDYFKLLKSEEDSAKTKERLKKAKAEGENLKAEGEKLDKDIKDLKMLNEFFETLKIASAK